MATEVTMPRLSDSMEEGTIIRWIVSEGDEVHRGEPLVEIETDKANMTYDADTDGTLVEIIAGEGDTLPIGELIARIGDAAERSTNGNGGRGADGEDSAQSQGGEGTGSGDAGPDAETGAGQGDGGSRSEAKAGDEEAGEAADSEASADEAGETGERSAKDGEAEAAEHSGGGGQERVRASPVARRMARDLDLELSRIEGSGPGGRIVKADVEAAAGQGGDAGSAEAGDSGASGSPPRAEAEAPDAGSEAASEGDERGAKGQRSEPASTGEDGPKGAVETQELNRMQRTISRRMAESKATAPDFELRVDIDMGRCVELRERLRDVAEPVPSVNDMIVKACANAMRAFPRVNGAYRDGRFELYSRVNVGVAVAAQDALVVPTVFDADRKSLGEIARTVRALVARVRDRKITPPELSGATFTVSNLGMYGIDSFTAVINPPQAAILAVGALKKRPAVDEAGRIVARELMSATLVCDHRILYGADGAEYLARVRELLEQPLSLAL